ncbi:type II toxin-antitoxin system YhaV family toxin [Methylobacterium sp. WL30]|uniref:type II toxin-antitoxin system YhaV family toxin n=1 Tax=unclassified Methylobacterium TaxID=2615210 RepID=UPI0011CA24C0|nr:MULTISPECIES: type II toxin-antitoxin system YhaV family toxin [unclassified Methylobacterium]MCJ2077366.1 type II toxin-antitoxin system YhaV family toxin [Methylobacterium sp. E-016]TXM88150.1 type II toxin-antitoxin system YhaV family toxin [Methylobacterium sp. WL116]TXN30517.1 type II toxin-antitoxin system YhaV family toxin [Methylobacterium sp. WL93]TXN49473.1 type II toxin-antitoxin system YhaV family toxin [Methylobacterium sp. WL119]TXN68667.1 type II toxin-antitoxin system YhaV f
MTVVGAWTIFAHPLLLDQLETLTATVEKAKADDPDGYRRTANAKLLAVLRRLMFETVPQDPSRAEYRQGDPLGASRKHWFRAKFGNGRFRPFFRYDSRTRILIYAWVNDAETLRTYGAKTDAYAVFERMLDKGHPPDDWATLLAAASAGPPKARLKTAAAK